MKIDFIRNSCLVIDELAESIDKADTYADENLTRFQENSGQNTLKTTAHQLLQAMTQEMLL